MASPVKGKNIMLYKHRESDNTDIPIACSNSCSFSINTSEIEVTDYFSGNFRKFKPDLNDFSISAEGLVILENYSYLLMLQDQVDQNNFLVKFVIDNGPDGFAIINGTVFISNVTITGANKEGGSYSITLRGAGEISFSGTQPDPSGVIIVNGSTCTMKQTAATSTGQTTFSFPDMVGKTMLYASRGGTDFAEIATSGTPPPNGLTWNNLTGTIIIETAAIETEFFRFIFQ